MSRSWRPQTRLVHGGTQRSPFGETSEALFLTSGFTYERAEDAEARFAETQEGYTYSRVGNPTVRMLEERMALLEGSQECIAAASGMAAVHAVLMSQLRSGMRVVGSALLFGSCHWILTQLCPRFGIEVELVDGKDLAAWERAFSRKADLVFLETPGNPTLELVDIAAVSELAHRAGAKVIVDNVFATPILQQPLELGADIVVYSATKHIDGQGRCLGGLICCDAELKKNVLQPYLRNTGPGLSPFNAWVLLKGLETLGLRVRAQTEAAGRIARFLEAHPKVPLVLYPGLESHPQRALAQRQMRAGGTLVAFRVGGGRQEAFAVMNRLELIKISNNLGDAKSLITHPGSTTHSKIAAAERLAIGITEDMLRLSIGLEDPEDLIADLDQALRA
ncbi:O-succinylhomoserine sulfhydrylase [Benzoatithermus flavus]|uniref:O-succinylhomoserine sulfhydrylase n=1 Tax=Benzoatithermus flavus TaxID=3108223 RepID=A0ABU8XXZ7_9PROT